MLKNIYGEIILKKDLILYHTSDEQFTYKSEKDKPMLFCTFHPSEYGMIGDYVTFVKLKKDVSLFFMVEEFKKARIFSSLSTLINHKNGNLAKKHNIELNFFSNKLKKENFDGWFSSIENKGTVEVALINDNNIFKIIESTPLMNNWNNGNINNNQVKIKNWGKKYKVYSIENPVIININERYKNMIEKYIIFEIETKLINQFIFQMIIKNAIITYHKYDYERIFWNKDNKN
jgi:hypothetical protein